MPHKPRIALIQPDSPFLTEPLSFPGLGLLYISSHLKQFGYNPKVYDLTGGRELPLNLKADILGFSCQVVHLAFAKKFVKKLRHNNPASIFVAGGPLATWMPKECLEGGFDIAIRGEGELSMLEIAQNCDELRDKIKNGDDYPKELVPKEDLNPNLIPLPDWDAIDISRYKYRLEGRRCMSIVTSRGNCPFGLGDHCRFCSKTNIGRSIPLRFRSAENVLEEAKILRDQYGIRALMIYDDEIMIKKERDLQIFRGLKNLDMKFRCMTRADCVNKEDLQKMKEYGCIEICLGAESGDPYILEEIVNKGTTVELNSRFIRWCHEVGLKVKAYLIIGLPSESRQSVKRTIAWLKATKPDNYDLSIFEPYPGSEFYEHKERYEIDWNPQELKKAWAKGAPQYDHSPVWTPYLTAEEIPRLRNQILKEIPRGIGGTTPYWGPNSIEP